MKQIFVFLPFYLNLFGPQNCIGGLEYGSGMEGWVRIDNLSSLNKLLVKKMLVQNKLWVKKFAGSIKFAGPNKFGSNKFCSKKTLCPKTFWVKNLNFTSKNKVQRQFGSNKFVRVQKKNYKEKSLRYKNSKK